MPLSALLFGFYSAAWLHYVDRPHESESLRKQMSLSNRSLRRKRDDCIESRRICHFDVITADMKAVKLNTE